MLIPTLIAAACGVGDVMKAKRKVASLVAEAKKQPIKFSAMPTTSGDFVEWKEVVVGAAGGGKFAALRQARGGASDVSRGPGASVFVSNSWSTIPKCNCPNAKKSRVDTDPFCTHVIALALQEPDIQYQLFDMFV